MIIKNKKYFIDQINSSKANKMMEAYHYSGTGFKKAKINLGIFRNEDSLLVGVLQWGCSAQSKIRLDRYVKESILVEEYLELNRFAMADSEGKNSESQAISLGIKWIKQNRPDIRLLVSYAGRKEGNYGYIYQATNWEYLGYFISKGFWEVDGREKHLITLCLQAAKSNKSFLETLKDKYSSIIETYTKQFIYIQRLDKTLTPASEILPYPKPLTDFPIKTKEIIHKQEPFILKEEKRKYPIYYYEKEEYLFSRRTLIKRGIIESKKRIPRKYAVYDLNGILEKTYNSVREMVPDGYYENGIYNAIKTLKSYKEKYIRAFNENEEIEEEIEVPNICIIDEIPFPSFSSAARYLEVSRQAVQQSFKRKGKKINGKEVFWCNNI